MHNLYIFDIDGTLTPSRRVMTEEFTKFFETWSNDNNYYLVTGSDLEKVKEQIPILYLERAQGIFTCCGNEFYKNKLWKTQGITETHTFIKYSNKFTVPVGLNDYLMDKVEGSKCPIRTGNHIENREAMVNFSVIGRDCSQEQRDEYFEWDKIHNERQKIVEEMKHKWPGLHTSIGGQISIDIYEPGMDKSQILSHIHEDFLEILDSYIFIGDRTEKGGNDYPLAKLLNNKSNGKVFQTEGPEHTQKILEDLDD